VVRHDSSGDFDISAGGHVGRGGLEEEKRLFGGSVAQLLDVLGVVPPNGDYLGYGDRRQSISNDIDMVDTFLPCRTNAAAVAMFRHWFTWLSGVLPCCGCANVEVVGLALQCRGKSDRSVDGIFMIALGSVVLIHHVQDASG
jgi:hypothetical protein